MIWNKPMEFAEREIMNKLQLAKLKQTIKHVYANCEPYRVKMQEAGLTPEDINSLEDLQKLPFTYKSDLRDNYPYGMFSVPLSSIVRIHASSGTTGKPTVVGYTRKDLDSWAECFARCLAMAGGDSKSVVQVAYGYGLFTGGLGAHAGAEYVGASVIPMSSGNTEKQILLMKDFKSTTLCCTPSYALTIAEAIEKNPEISLDDISLKSGIFGAEPWTVEMRKEIEKRLNIRAHDIYGLSEIMGPGVSCSCEHQNGMHINEDYFLPEIIDPETLEVLPHGEKGELVFTTIGKEGIPLIRYRTRDIAYLMPETCECGRTTIRMSRVMGRTDDMLIIRGVNVFPTQIETVIANFAELTMNYKIIVDRVNNSDTFEIQIELAEGLTFDNIKFIESLRAKLSHELRSILGISAKLTFLNEGTLPRSEGKAVRVEDRRDLV